MSIQKTISIVLSTTPYRESSLLVTLLSPSLGRFQGIAKGIRSAGKRTVPLERGIFIEHIVYLKESREIQTLADIQIVNFFPEIRQSIEKTAVRDTTFELLLASVKGGDHGSELYSLMESFISSLSASVASASLLSYKLWTFHFDFAAIMGFANNFHTCLQCETLIDNLSDGGYLIHEKGGIYCQTCGRSRIHQNFFIPQILLSDKSTFGTTVESLQKITSTEWIRLIRLASAYCRIHLDFKYTLRSLEFLEQVLW